MRILSMEKYNSCGSIKEEEEKKGVEGYCKFSIFNLEKK